MWIPCKIVEYSVCLSVSLFASVKFHCCREHTHTNISHDTEPFFPFDSPSLSLSRFFSSFARHSFNNSCPIICAWESKLYRNRLFVFCVFFFNWGFFRSRHVRNRKSIKLFWVPLFLFVRACFCASVELECVWVNLHSICTVFTTHFVCYILKLVFYVCVCHMRIRILNAGM